MNQISDIYFASFADSRMKIAFNRLRRQAKKFGFNSKRTHLLDEHDLDDSFVRSMSARLIPGSRGFGYWCWKPQVVLQMFDIMQDGDILLYADAGCHLNPNGRKRFQEYIRVAEEQDLTVFEQEALDRCWTKGDVFRFFGTTPLSPVGNSGQIWGGAFLVKKTHLTKSLFARFVTIVTEHFELIDDSPSSTQNALDFRENRHDQSVFSILCKGLPLKTIPASEASPLNNPSYPISAKRDIAAGWRGYMPYRLKRLYNCCGTKIRVAISHWFSAIS